MPAHNSKIPASRVSVFRWQEISKLKNGAYGEMSIVEYQKKDKKSSIKLFESKQIRSVWNEQGQKWYFVVEDVIQVLTDTPNPSDYIKKMRQRDDELAKGWGQFVTPLSANNFSKVG